MALCVASAIDNETVLLKANDASPQPMDVRQFSAARKFADLPYGRIAYVEQGHGSAALFLHGYPLNGYQWRGALSRLSTYRRCIAPDFLGLGYTQAPEGKDLTPGTQMAMLAKLLDTIGEEAADSPEWLSRTFPKSRGVRRVEGAKLFWPEEFPDLIAQEARSLWGVLG
jgi:hypothetical protein